MPELALRGGKPVRTKPYPSWPVFDTDEQNELLEALKGGRWSIGGEKLMAFEAEFAAFHQARYGVACSSGSAALVIALKALGVGPGDHVLVPAYTFVSTAQAVLDLGATPVFVDVDQDTYTISIPEAERQLTPRTKVVVPVHVAGCPADMDEVRKFSDRHGVRILEDAAQAHGAEWSGRRVGAIGDLGVFSFYQSKNMTAGEGGFIVTDSQGLADLVWSFHNVGRDRRREWYEHVRYGWNARMTEFQAAVLRAQLRRLPQMMTKREDAASYLTRRLDEIEGIAPLKIPPKVTRHSHHLYIFRFSSAAFGGISKESFVSALRAEGIPCSKGYTPLYAYGFLWEAMREKVQDRSSLKLVNAEKAVEEAVWIPQNVLLASREELDDIVEAVEKIKRCSGELT